jgi:hypothetical protein
LGITLLTPSLFLTQHNNALAPKKQSLVDFAPHYLTWVCQAGASSPECATQCIRRGRYCAPDPDGDTRRGYTGIDVLKVRACVCARDCWCDMTRCVGAKERERATP